MNHASAQIEALKVQAMAIQAEIAGMQMHDAYRIEFCQGDGVYIEDGYHNLAEQLRVIANDIQNIAMNGGLE